MTLQATQLRDRLASAAHEIGFDLFGVASIGEAHDHSDRLLMWLAHGYHASMAWMERNAERRAEIRRVLPGAKTVISLGLNYYRPETPNEGCGDLKVARYAWGEDYHKIVERKLEVLLGVLRALAPEEQALTYVDTGPVMEKAWAERAGLGWIGKNTCLISKPFGSWVFLGEIITTALIAPDVPHSDFCGSCTRCLDACPTDAFPEPYVLDSNKCISYWTIEHRGDIPSELASEFDGWIFGCDICQDVCPWNKFSRPTSEPAFTPRCDCLCPPAEQWANLSLEEFQSTFADSAIRRAKPEGLARNIGSQSRDALSTVLRSSHAEPEAPDRVTD
jgi:epoxyqueuosine reductase